MSPSQSSGFTVRQNPATNHARILAPFIGLALGCLLSIWLADLSATAVLAVWLMGLAIGLIAGGLFQQRQPVETRWHMLIAGQMLGIGAMALLFILSLV